MSSGRDHARASLTVSMPVGLLVYAYTGNPLFGAAACAGSILGVLLSPDLDVDHMTYSERVVYIWFGRIIGAAWLIYWWPYGKLIPHRSPLSHFPILGTAIRIIYLWPLLLLFGYDLPRDTLFLWLYAGLAVSDTIHFIMDNLPKRS